MPPRAAIIVTAKGNAMTRNPARIVFAADCLRTMTYSATREAIIKRWGIHKATAEKDIRAAKQLIALELDSLEVRAAEARRNERIADRAEELAAKATARAEAEGSSAADWGAVAALQRSAIAASREVSRLTGAYTPTRVSVTHSQAGPPELALKLDAILGILDAAGIAALHVVLEQIEAARADGRLAAPAEEEIEDAEYVDVPPQPQSDGPGN